MFFLVFKAEGDTAKYGTLLCLEGQEGIPEKENDFQRYS